MSSYASLVGGLNLWGHTASVNMAPGDALDAKNIHLRLDGSFGKHWGCRRINHTAFTGRVVGHKGFPYKGKNNATPGSHPGNFGVANDAGSTTPSRRVDFYSTAVIVTANNEIRFWNPATQTYDLPTANINGRGGGVWLPTGVTTLPLEPKPSFEVHNDNLYIVGLGNNLRYDPVDRGLYLWGWENTPSLAPVVGYVAGASDLINGARYLYRASWVDLYTGEESELSAPFEFIVGAGGNNAVDFGGAPASGVNLANYAGDRHWAPAGDLADSDVGIAIYRTLADGEKFYFLGLIYPNTATATTWSDGTALVDAGLAVDTSLPGKVRDYQDPPVLNAFCQYMDMWWGVSWENNWGRLYFNDFEGENSFWERWDPRQYISCQVGDGEFLVAPVATNKSVVVISNNDAFEVTPTITTTGRLEKPVRQLNWDVGIVGPKAKKSMGGTLYFIAARGPYRWMPGMQKPEWIGKKIAPLFIDAETDLCQLNAAGQMETEINYCQDADVLRMAFACGSSLIPNRHLTYPMRAVEMSGRADNGFIFMGPQAQCFDLTNTLTGLGGDGLPVRPWERRVRTVFGDELGYVYEYDLGLWTEGLAGASRLTGTGQAGSGVALLVTEGDLYNTGDGLTGLWVEVEYSDGASEMRRVAANTATNITPDVPFSRDPTAATWYVAGYPAYWESWVDHMGDPHSHKKVRHLAVGFNQEAYSGDQVVDVTVKVANEWPAVARREHTCTLTQYRDKKLINAVGRFFTYQFANSRPGESFLITNFDPMDKAELLQRRRR